MTVVRPIEDEEGWQEWVESRPPCVRELIKQLPPDRLYRLDGDGHRVLIHSYNEDGTVCVDVSGDYNFVIFERSVFGVNPADLEECDLPSANEPCGVALTDDQQVESYCEEHRNGRGKEFIDSMLENVRPNNPGDLP